MGWRLVLVCSVCGALAFVGSNGAAANASSMASYIYWATDNGTTWAIGRANLDGSNPDRTFIAGGVAGAPRLAVNDHYLYWANFLDGTIGRARVDGTDVNPNLITGITGRPLDLVVNGQYIYWANNATGAIGRANLNGSEVIKSFIPGVHAAGDLAVNGHFVYWTNFFTGTIGRATLSGTDFNQRFITGAREPSGIAVAGHYIYWANTATGAIGRASLDGADPDQSFVAGSANPNKGHDAVDVTVNRTHLYWANLVSGKRTGAIGRANLDGTDVNQNFIATRAPVYRVAVSPA